MKFADGYWQALPGARHGERGAAAAESWNPGYRPGRRLVVEALGTHRPWSAHVSGGRLVHVSPGTLLLEIEL